MEDGSTSWQPFHHPKFRKYIMALRLWMDPSLWERKRDSFNIGHLYPYDFESPYNIPWHLARVFTLPTTFPVTATTSDQYNILSVSLLFWSKLFRHWDNNIRLILHTFINVSNVQYINYLSVQLNLSNCSKSYELWINFWQKY